MYVYYDKLIVNLGETDVSVILRSEVTKNLTVPEQAFCSVNREILRFAQNDVSPLKKGVMSYTGGAKRSENQVFWCFNPLNKRNLNWRWGAGPETFSKTWFFQESHDALSKRVWLTIKVV